MDPQFHFDELIELMRNLTTPSALTEAGVLAACLGLSWMLCRLARRVSSIDGSVLFGRRLFDGVLFPVLALALALIAQQVLSGVVKAAVFKLAIPILTSLVLIRLTVRVLTAAFPESAWMRRIETTVSWVAWIGVVLWVTGVLPVVLAQLDEFKWKIGKSQVSLRNMIEGAMTAAVVMMLALWLSAVLERKIIRGTGSDLSLRKIFSNIVRGALLSIGVLFAMSAVGIDLTALSVLGGAVGVGLGFGLQKVAANYVSGFVILFERMLRIGDTVKVDGFEGRITDIRTRYTVIRAATGREAIVPNEMLIIQRVENASLNTEESKVQITVTLQVGQSTDVRALQPKLESALARIPRVLKTPAPFIQLNGFVPGGMEIAVKYWLSDPNRDQDLVKSEVNLAVLDTLNEQRVEFAAPQQRLVLQPAVGLGAGLRPSPEDPPG